jgi:hypothetical protein
MKEGLPALVGKLLSKLPLIGPKLAGHSPKGAEGEAYEEEYGPATISVPGKTGEKAGGAERKEALKGFVDAVLGNRVAVGLILAFLLVLIAFVVVSFVVSSPPEVQKSASGAASPAGKELLRRGILPSGQGLEARVELEREQRKVYTAEEAARFRTDPASVDLRKLHEANQAELEALYASVP